MTDYFDFAAQLSRQQARQKDELIEPITAEEHAYIEREFGFKMTAEEAYIAFRSETLRLAFETWLDSKKVN